MIGAGGYKEKGSTRDREVGGIRDREVGGRKDRKKEHTRKQTKAKQSLKNLSPKFL